MIVKYRCEIKLLNCYAGGMAVAVTGERPSSGILPLADPMGPPCELFWLTDPKILWRHYKLNLRGERAQKKAIFSRPKFPKRCLKRLFDLFFQNLACGCRKKGRQNFLLFILNLQQISLFKRHKTRHCFRNYSVMT